MADHTPTIPTTDSYQNDEMIISELLIKFQVNHDQPPIPLRDLSPPRLALHSEPAADG